MSEFVYREWVYYSTCLFPDFGRVLFAWTMRGGVGLRLLGPSQCRTSFNGSDIFDIPGIWHRAVKVSPAKGKSTIETCMTGLLTPISKLANPSSVEVGKLHRER